MSPRPCEVMADALHLFVRTVHLLGVITLVGGSAGAWYALRATTLALDPALARFESAYWAAFGVVVVTGVGNLGAVGAPGPATPWGATLTLKLSVVFAVVVGSMLRTLAVLRSEPADLRRADRRRRLGLGYAATAGALLVVVGLAEVLAHG